MNDQIILHYQIPSDDFTRAGEASSNVKRKLKKMGFDPVIIRRVAITMYEGEINMIIHANGGFIDVIVSLDKIEIIFNDTGPGIEDIDLAMSAGYSTAPDNIRSLGFGAGMGLPNMKNNSDDIKVESELDKGTKVYAKILVS